MIRIPKDFKELLQLLTLDKVKYLVVGGYAVALYGYPRATGDIDIWIAMTKTNAKKIVKVLKEFGFDVQKLNKDIFLVKNKNIRMGLPPMRIEILTSIDGVEFDKCYKNKNQTIIDGIKINFISKDDLKINKKASGRYKDLEDLENL